MADFLPDKDADLVAWIHEFALALTDAPADYGLLPADAVAVTAVATAFADAVQSTRDADNALKTTVVDKKAKRAAAETLVRATVRRIQAYPGLTDAARQNLKITIRDTTPSSAPAPTTRPTAEVDTSQALRHIIHFKDQGATTKGKPRGVKGCEIWYLIGVVPVDVTDAGDAGNMVFMALDTASPYLASFDQADAGKKVYYRMRWVSNSGEFGPWSEVVEATIVG